MHERGLCSFDVKPPELVTELISTRKTRKSQEQNKPWTERTTIDLESKVFGDGVYFSSRIRAELMILYQFMSVRSCERSTTSAGFHRSARGKKFTACNSGAHLRYIRISAYAVLHALQR